jgi:hypothetical protein
MCFGFVEEKHCCYLSVLPPFDTHCWLLQESAVECLAALTQYSQKACQQLLQHTPSHTQQQQLASTQQPKQAAAAGPEQQPQQQQMLPAVVQRLLQLMREYDSRLRFQCAACICHLSRGGAQQETARMVSQAAY